MKCAYCDEEILPGERADNYGADLHHECMFRGVAGSVGHQKRECSCFGRKDNSEPPGMTRREGARLALQYWRDTHPWKEPATKTNQR